MSMDRTLGEIMQADVETLMGPFTALGNPDDYLPAPGPAKIYRGHDTWRDMLVALATKAQAIIVVEGITEGLTWELGFAIAVPREVVLVCADERQTRFPSFCFFSKGAVAKSEL